jgi:hypothetical protein
VTAATWVGGTGALLLLAAAGTFLAVAWDTMGLAARIAVVAAVTGTAILGGHLLRRRLPAVGSVVFHLGALLVPVDALGLALQLDAGPAGRWVAVGGAGMVTFPVLAAVSRSRVLAWATVVAAPVLATGVGLATWLDAPPILALLAAAGLAAAASARVLRPDPAPDDADRDRFAADGPRRVLRIGPAVLAVAAVHLPLLVMGVLDADASVAGELVAAGWAAGWASTSLTTLLSIAVLVAAAARLRLPVLAGLAPVTAATGTLLILGPQSPQLVSLLALPVLALLLELAALATHGDPFWRRATRPAAELAEVLGLLVLPVTVAAVLVPSDFALVTRGDLAFVAGVVAVAWTVSAVRRVLAVGWRRGPVVVALGLAWLHLLAAVALAGPALDLRPWIASLAVVASRAWLPRPSVASDQRALVQGWGAALGVAIVGGGLAITTSWTSGAVGVVGAAMVVVLAAHARAVSRTSPGDAAAGLAVVLPAVWAAAIVTVGAPGVAGVPSWLRAVVLVAALLAVAGGVDRLPLAADLLRAAAAVLALWVPIGRWSSPGLEAEQRLMVDTAAPGRIVIAVTVMAAIWLLVDGVRQGRPRLAALAAPVLVRAVLSVGLEAGVAVEVLGMVLLVTAAMAASVVLDAGRWRLPATVFAAVGGTSGWLLLGDAAALRAWITVVFGAAVVVLGIRSRRTVVGHVGGALMVVGVWWLLSLAEVTATDVWVAPVALQLWVAGWLARRMRGTSSWLTDVPPLLLVAVPALVERLAGGPGWHALLAGGLAVLAVAVGGARRLGGPLIVGSQLVVAVVLVETFAIVASVPTWAWLALGGSILLGAAVLIERTGVSPVASARRLVEVIDERFG